MLASFGSRAEGITAVAHLLLECRQLSSAPESNKQIPPDITLDLPFFFHYKHITSLKKVPSPAPSESLRYWFLDSFAAMLVLNYWLREFLLAAFANRFELRCEPKQLMLLFYKICPCYVDVLAIFNVSKDGKPDKASKTCGKESQA